MARTKTKTTKTAARKGHKFLRLLKDQYGVSNADLQQLLDTTPRTVARYLSGAAKPVGAAKAVLVSLELAEEQLEEDLFRMLLRAGCRFGAAAMLSGALSQLKASDKEGYASSVAGTALSLARRFLTGD